MTQQGGGAQQRAGVFGFFVGAAELALKRSGFNDALVADADGDEVDGPALKCQGGVDDCVEQAELGLEQFSGAATAAFQEHLERVPIAQEPANIGFCRGGVQLVPTEGAANEKGAAPSRHGPRGEEGQVVAGCDQR